MFCKKCGNKIDDDSVFCSMCGMMVGKASTQSMERFFSNKCEACGAHVKELSSNHYICEYCGSEYRINKENTITDAKTTEKKIMDVFYKAAEYENNDKFFEELQCLLDIEDIASDNVVFLVKLGRAYRRNNLYQKAIECYEKAVQLNSQYATIYINIGAVYIVTRQYEQAKVSCFRGIELMNKNRVEYSNDDYAIAYSNLAIIVGMQGQKKEAMKYLKIAEENGYKNGAEIRKRVGIKKGLFSLM